MAVEVSFVHLAALLHVAALLSCWAKAKNPGYFDVGQITIQIYEYCRKTIFKIYDVKKFSELLYPPKVPVGFFVEWPLIEGLS